MSQLLNFTMSSLIDIINNLPLAIAIVDDELTVRMVNKQVLNFTKKKESELVGKVGGDAFGCAKVYGKPENCSFGKECLGCKLRIMINETFLTDQPQFKVEVPMEFHNRGERILRFSTQPIILENCKMILLAVEDITAVKKKEKTIIVNEKLKSAVETGGAICHEMNQPLQVIITALDLITLSVTSEFEAYDEVIEIGQQVTKLTDLVSQLMQITTYKTKKYIEKGTILDIEQSSKL